MVNKLYVNNPFGPSVFIKKSKIEFTVTIAYVDDLNTVH